MKPIFSRIGNKYLISDKIVELMPEHNKYIEVFCGGASVLFKKPKIEHEVINDIDTDLIDDYKLLMKVGKYKKTQELNKIDLLTKFISTEHKNIQDQFTARLIRRCNGFSGNRIKDNKTKVYQPSDPNKKLSILSEYQDRLKNVVFMNENYKKVLIEHDSKDALFYLDPPYENSSNLYSDSIVEYKILSDDVRKLKGKFILSMADSATIRYLFKDFNFKVIQKKKALTRKCLGYKARTEILIYNFDE